MSDLVQRLRDPARCVSWAAADRIMGEAADEIERLQATLDAAIAKERERIAAWLDMDWPADAPEERYHRAWIATKLRLGPVDNLPPK